jgi:hypothetical protein
MPTGGRRGSCVFLPGQKEARRNNHGAVPASRPAPQSVLPFTSRQSRVTSHDRSTGHSMTSRNARNSLKTNDGDLFYPTHFPTHNYARAREDFRLPAPRTHASPPCQWKRRASSLRKAGVDVTFFLSRWSTRAKSSVSISPGRKTPRVLGRLIGTPERLELDVTRCESTAVTLLIGTDRVPELHRCYTPQKSKQGRRVRA